jgi:hypothetical protein
VSKTPARIRNAPQTRPARHRRARSTMAIRIVARGGGRHPAGSATRRSVRRSIPPAIRKRVVETRPWTSSAARRRRTPDVQREQPSVIR